MSDAEPLAALRGAFGFLSRLPMGRDEPAWDAFRSSPWTLPVAGYALGACFALVVGLALLGPAPAPTVALGYVVAVVLLTGINHADGVADLGDAAVVHGGPERRREVMGDTVTGVGGTLALVLVVAGLVLAGLGLVAVPVATAVGLIVTAEVAAKLAMAALVSVGDPAHDGFGAAVAGDVRARAFLGPIVLAVPAIVLPGVPVGAAAFGGALVVATALLWWSNRRLGGVTGDVFGAANELARVIALHAGLVAWHVGPPGVWRPLAALSRLAEVITWTPW